MTETHQEGVILLYEDGNETEKPHGDREVRFVRRSSSMMGMGSGLDVG